MSNGVIVSKQGLLCFSHLHPNLTSNFSLPASGLGPLYPGHLFSLQCHKVFRGIVGGNCDLHLGPASSHHYGVLGAVGSWGNAVGRFARKFGRNKTSLSVIFFHSLCSVTRGKEGAAVGRQGEGQAETGTTQACKALFGFLSKQGQSHTQERRAPKPYFYTCK